ncbi:MAG: hypothetical protein J6113_09235 [Lachnospiraceae bacterium]|nr:hypothetical protein [Lachnospiraceae bacterium]
MKYVLIILVMALVGLFVWLLSQDTKEADKQAEENRKQAAAAKAGKKAISSLQTQCFDAYRKQLAEERNLGLIKSALSGNTGLRYVAELFAFREETEARRLMSYEYRQQLAARVLNPLNDAVSQFCPYKAGSYTLPEGYDMFLTPEEYYDQQLSYRGTAAIYQTDLEFWQERLDLTNRKRARLKEDPANRFWFELWEALKPFFEEMQVKYRKDIEEAPSREAALLFTKDLTERIEQELFRKGVSVMRYFSATPNEREKYFKTEASGSDRPAIIRESDGICLEKGAQTTGKKQ